MKNWLMAAVMIFAHGAFLLPAQEFENIQQCNRYVRDVISGKFGEETYDMIFEGKHEDTNTMFDSFRKNPNLERLDPKVHDIQGIQKLADSGVLVLMIYQNKTSGENGHIAFVGHSGLKLFTIPPMPGHEGKTGTSLPKDELVLVQAGYYTGIVSIAFVINGWNDPHIRRDLLENSVYFYTIKMR